MTRVGANVTSLKPGDRAGVGAQVGSCLQCRACNDNYENYCPHMIHTYVSISHCAAEIEILMIYATEP